MWGAPPRLTTRSGTLRRIPPRILLKAGVDLGMLGKDEICCGSPVARIGDRETFMGLALRNIEMLNKSGVKEIVAFCPGCFRAITHDYKEIPNAPKACRQRFITRPSTLTS